MDFDSDQTVLSASWNLGIADIIQSAATSYHRGINFFDCFVFLGGSPRDFLLHHSLCFKCAADLKKPRTRQRTALAVALAYSWWCWQDGSQGQKVREERTQPFGFCLPETLSVISLRRLQYFSSDDEELCIGLSPRLHYQCFLLSELRAALWRAEMNVQVSSVEEGSSQYGVMVSNTNDSDVA